MCLAIPARIVAIESPEMARARIGESATFLSVSTMLLPEPVQVGDYVIVHAGFAMHKMDEKEAQDSLAALREIAEAALGACNF